MAQKCGFFDAHLVGEDYDRVYIASQFAAYFASFISNGIFGHSMQQLEVASQEAPDMSIKVLPGQGWINGYWYENSDFYVLHHSVADGLLSRIDTVVLRWSQSDREIYLHVIEGEPSMKPVAPDIARNADYYDLGLAWVSVPAGSVRITQAQITDLRLNNAYCGLVTGLIDQIDTTDLYNQFTAYFNEFKEFYEKDYADWTTEQKEAYIEYITNQQNLYESWVQQKQDDYDTWTENKKNEYDAWVDAQEEDFVNWAKASKKRYEDWTAEQRAEYRSWVANTKKEYEDWTAEQKRKYLEWIAAQQLEYREWYDNHIPVWTKEFIDWFESIKDKLSDDKAGSLQLQINDQQKLIDNLYDMIYSNRINAPLVGTDGYHIKASDGSYLMGTEKICKCENKEE